MSLLPDFREVQLVNEELPLPLKRGRELVVSGVRVVVLIFDKVEVSHQEDIFGEGKIFNCLKEVDFAQSVLRKIAVNHREGISLTFTVDKINNEEVTVEGRGDGSLLYRVIVQDPARDHGENTSFPSTRMIAVVEAPVREGEFESSIVTGVEVCFLKQNDIIVEGELSDVGQHP